MQGFPSRYYQQTHLLPQVMKQLPVSLHTFQLDANWGPKDLHPMYYQLTHLLPRGMNQVPVSLHTFQLDANWGPQDLHPCTTSRLTYCPG